MKIKKWYLLPTLLSSSCILVAPLSSCGKGQQITTDPIIFEPIEYNAKSIITKDGVATIKFLGFHCNGINNYHNLTVQTTFKKGVTQFLSSVINWNTQTKTFDVKIDVLGGAETDYVGNILFYYNGQPVPTNFLNSFKINLYWNRIIGDPQSGTTITHLLMPDEEMVVVYINGFIYSDFRGEESEWDNIAVSNSQVSAIGGFCYIDFIEETTKTFRVRVEIKNIQELPKPLTLIDKFDFFYKDMLITHVDISLFTINVIDDAFVTQPDSSVNEIIVNEGAGSILIKNFKLSSLMTPDMITIKSTFKQGESSQFDCEIVNWSSIDNTFDIKVDMSGVSIGSVTGKFIFLHNDLPIGTNDSEFTLNIMSCFPKRYLKIEEHIDETTGQLIETLVGFTDDLPPNPPYNILLVPKYVTDISESAFLGAFRDPNHLVQLRFDDDCVIKSLGNYAFSENPSLVGNLNIARSIDNIGEGCFWESGLDGELHMSLDCFNDVVFGNGSFYTCKLTSLYLSNFFAPNTTTFELCGYVTLVDITDTLMGKTLPNWIINMGPNENGIFDGLGKEVEESVDHKIICKKLSNPDKQLLISSLERCGLDLDLWKIVEQ